MYLGILIESTLTFTGHIGDMTAIANRRLGFVKRNLRGTPPDVRKMAYVSLVRSKLEYGPTVWDPYYKVHSNEIEKIQNRAIRWIFDKRPREKVRITSLRNQLELDRLEKRRETHKLCESLLCRFH